MIEKFLSTINKNNGLAKASRFDVLITGGPLGLINSSNMEEMSFLCESAEIPGRSIITADAKTYGPTFKIPYQSQFPEITLTFLSTSELKERKFFENWMDQISFMSLSSPGITRRTFNYNFPSTYYGNVIIQNYREVGGPGDKSPEGPIFKTTLREAFPLSISAQPLSWMEDGFIRVSVQFTYRYYEMTPQTTQSSSAPAPLPVGFTI